MWQWSTVWAREEKGKHQLISLRLTAAAHRAESLTQAALAVLPPFTFPFLHVPHGQLVTVIFSST